MLIAWGRGKKGRYYAGYEDEIVSAVFGHLSYFEAAQRNKVFQTILNHALMTQQPVSLQIRKSKVAIYSFGRTLLKKDELSQIF